MHLEKRWFRMPWAWGLAIVLTGVLAAWILMRNAPCRSVAHGDVAGKKQLLEADERDVGQTNAVRVLGAFVFNLMCAATNSPEILREMLLGNSYREEHRRLFAFARGTNEWERWWGDTCYMLWCADAAMYASRTDDPAMLEVVYAFCYGNDPLDEGLTDKETVELVTKRVFTIPTDSGPTGRPPSDLHDTKYEMETSFDGPQATVQVTVSWGKFEHGHYSLDFRKRRVRDEDVWIPFLVFGGLDSSIQ